MKPCTCDYVTGPNCPHCDRPLREIFKDSRDGVRRFVCDVALRGLGCGKIGPGYRHDKAWIYVERKER